MSGAWTAREMGGVSWEEPEAPVLAAGKPESSSSDMLFARRGHQLLEMVQLIVISYAALPLRPLETILLKIEYWQFHMAMNKTALDDKSVRDDMI